MIDKRPRLIVQCADVADVMTAVRFARDNALLLAVRGGGHNGGGLRVDPAAHSVRAEGGCTWGEVDHATHAFGLASPSGVISTTGVGGLTLGGGIGYLSRRFGLTIDNLLSVDMVLADGSFVTASAKVNEDLFWAVRGGGGNFGVVTSFEFRLHDLSTVVAGPTLWPLERAAEVLRWYRGFLPSAPPELNGFFAFITVPPAPSFPPELHLQKMCGIVWCYAGDAAHADAALAPVRAMAPVLDGLASMPYPVLQSAFDGLYVPGLHWYWRADFVNELSDSAIALHVKHGAQMPTLHSSMHLYPIDAAVHRVGRKETAFAARDARWAAVYLGVTPDPAQGEQVAQWSKDYWQALHPHAAAGAYVNFMMDEGQDRVKAAYRDNYARLAAIKARYDPDNLFRVNQNIRPAG